MHFEDERVAFMNYDRHHNSARNVSRVAAASLLLALLLSPGAARSENIRFPEISIAAGGVYNVKNFGATGDGVTDDTAAIQSAIESAEGWWNAGTVYFPNGTYRISDTLEATSSSSSYSPSGFVLQGQSRNGVRLFAAPGFGSKAMIDTLTDKSWSNTAFVNFVQNLTIDVGQDNPDATALNFHANNTGAVRDVRIVSSDAAKRGKYGLQLGPKVGPGPCLIQRVVIDGFQTGIRVVQREASLTLEDITLTNQSVDGFQNSSNVVHIRKLTSIQSNANVPAVRNTSDQGMLTLVDATLTNIATSPRSAIENNGHLFARDIATTGYTSALRNNNATIAGANVAEFTSSPGQALWPATQRSLRLPIQDTPEVPWDNPATWANVRSFGATHDNTSDDDSIGIQRAIDSGAQTIYFGHGKYRLNQTVIVRGNVKRLIGAWTRITVGSNLLNRTVPVFRFENTSADAVFIDGFHFEYYNADSHFFCFEHASPKPVVIRDIHMNAGKAYRNTPAGTGALFLENVFNQDQTNKSTDTSPVWVFANGQRVWARQINPEHDNATKVLNNGAVVWMLGIKTENFGTAVETRGGGYSEVLGGFLFPGNAGTVLPPEQPAFINHESQMSVTACEHQGRSDKNQYSIVMRETRGGVARLLLDDGLPNRDLGQSFVLTRYSGVLDSALVPLYRLDYADAYFLLTNNPAQHEYYAASGWTSRPAPGWVYPQATGAPGLVALYQLYATQTFDFFYTANAAERDAAVAGGYYALNVIGWVFTQPGTGRVPLYRAYNFQTGRHRFTGDLSEYNGLSAPWIREGIAAYLLSGP